VLVLQGWVDEEAETGGNPFANFFGGGKKKEAEEKEVQAAKEAEVEEPKKKGFLPI